MKNKKIITTLRFSAQRALLGMIYPNIRAIAVGYENDILKVIIYFDREPVEDDYENLAIITTEIIADFPEFHKVEEKCVYSEKRINELEPLDFWAYIRKED